MAKKKFKQKIHHQWWCIKRTSTPQRGKAFDSNVLLFHFTYQQRTCAALLFWLRFCVFRFSGHKFHLIDLHSPAPTHHPPFLSAMDTHPVKIMADSFSPVRLKYLSIFNSNASERKSIRTYRTRAALVVRKNIYIYMPAHRSLFISSNGWALSSRENLAVLIHINQASFTQYVAMSLVSSTYHTGPADRPIKTKVHTVWYIVDLFIEYSSCIHPYVGW